MIDNTIELVKKIINEVLVENGLELDVLYPETKILKDTQLDSMGLAIVVSKLEEKTGLDPFVGGFIQFNTVKELAKLYGK